MIFRPRLESSGDARFFRRALRGFAGARGGVSAVEFAFVVPIAVYLFAGAVDYGLAFYFKMQAQQAAQAGAEYAIIHGFNPLAASTDASSPTATSNAVVNATTFSGIAASPAPTSYCGCASAKGVVNAECGDLCSDGTAAGIYLTVSASGTYNTLVPYPIIPKSFKLNGSATVRMR
jgi:Flp pilus assembly protein TadG